MTGSNIVDLFRKQTFQNFTIFFEKFQTASNEEHDLQVLHLLTIFNNSKVPIINFN